MCVQRVSARARAHQNDASRAVWRVDASEVCVSVKRALSYGKRDLLSAVCTSLKSLACRCLRGRERRGEGRGGRFRLIDVFIFKQNCICYPSSTLYTIHTYTTPVVLSVVASYIKYIQKGIYDARSYAHEQSPDVVIYTETHYPSST